MANVFDYLDWRGDLPFSADPFNAVDNLIFCELTYVDFDDIVPGEDSAETMPLSEVSRRYFSMHTDMELMARDTLFKMTPFLLKKAAATRRFGNVGIGRFVNMVSVAAEEQMAAMVFYPESSLPFAAFRGTDDTLIGWKEDINLSFSDGTSGQRHAAEYLSERLRETPGGLTVGGHSKGGNFAVYASAFCKDTENGKIQDRIRRVYTNDGPGFLKQIIESDGYRSILPRIRSTIPEGSVFGLLLDSGSPHRVVKSSGKGLMQHNGLTWQVLGNRFETLPETSHSSLFIQKTVRQWIDTFSLEDRAAFSDAVYSFLTAGGSGTLTDLSHESLAIRIEAIRSFRKMDPEKKTIIQTVLRHLLESGAKTLQAEAQNQPIIQGFAHRQT